VHVVADPRPDRPQEGAVDPVDDGAVELARPPESLSILIHRGHEDVLHLEIAAWVEQGQGVDEALGSTAGEVEAHVLGCVAEQVFEMALLEPRGQGELGEAVERDQSLVQADGVPDGPPEGRAASAVAHGLGPDLEQAEDRSRQVGGRHAEGLREALGGLRPEIGARLDHIEAPVAPHQLVVGQVVVDVGQVDVEDLEAEEGERAEGIQRVHGEHAHRVAVARHGGQRPVQRRHGVVAEEEAKARVVSRPALLVESPEAVEPEGRPRARAHPDLEREDLRRKLAALVHVPQQRPEVRHGIRYRLRVIGVGPPAGQRLLEAASGRLLPVAQALPEEPVEAPDETVPDRPEIIEP